VIVHDDDANLGGIWQVPSSIQILRSLHPIVQYLTSSRLEVMTGTCHHAPLPRLEGRKARRAAKKPLHAVVLISPSREKSDFGTPMGSIGPQKSGNPGSCGFNELRRSFVVRQLEWRTPQDDSQKGFSGACKAPLFPPQ
jgi:hypothetical protein